MVQFWVSGLVKSYGVLFVEVLEAFSDTSAAVAAWIPAILSTLCLALGEWELSSPSLVMQKHTFLSRCLNENTQET